MRTNQKDDLITNVQSTKANIEEIIPNHPIELAVLSVKERAARCRILKSSQELTLRAERLWDLVPGQIIKVNPIKAWNYQGHPYLSGKIITNRFDIAALRLVPLKLKQKGLWDPKDEYWGEEESFMEDWPKPIIHFGPRPQFEMEQVIPGADPDDPFDDPILEASELNQGGDARNARKLLMEVLSQDLRCLDAHAHLGNFIFDRRPEEAIQHYEVGVRIGELALGEEFNGVLKWGFINNRPFLRCLEGFGLCLWRLGRIVEATESCHRLLWLNPCDNQGVRAILLDIKEGLPWKADH